MLGAPGVSSRCIVVARVAGAAVVALQGWRGWKERGVGDTSPVVVGRGIFNWI